MRGTSHNQRGTKYAKGRWLTETSGAMGVCLSSSCSCIVVSPRGSTRGKPTPHPTPGRNSPTSYFQDLGMPTATPAPWASEILHGDSCVTGQEVLLASLCLVYPGLLSFHSQIWRISLDKRLLLSLGQIIAWEWARSIANQRWTLSSLETPVCSAGSSPFLFPPCSPLLFFPQPLGFAQLLPLSGALHGFTSLHQPSARPL